MAQNPRVPAPLDTIGNIEAVVGHFDASDWMIRWIRQEILLLRSLFNMPPHLSRRPDVMYYTLLHQHLLLYFSRCLNNLIHPDDRRRFSSTDVRGFFSRICTLFFRPSQFATVFLDFCSLLYSLWNGSCAGPECILPMSSLAKRSSGRLSKLLLQHSRDIPRYEPEMGTFPSESDSPSQIVAVMDLSNVPPHFAKGAYGTGADFHGLVSMLLLAQILTWLIAPSSLMFIFFFPKAIGSCTFASVLGDGTLALLQRPETRINPSPGYAVLFDDDFTLLVQGRQDLVEAVTLRGFRLSHQVADLYPRPLWKLFGIFILEGFFQGLISLIFFIPVFRLIDPGPSFLMAFISRFLDSVQSYLKTLIPAPWSIGLSSSTAAYLSQILIPMALVCLFMHVPFFLVVHRRFVWTRMGHVPTSTYFPSELLTIFAEELAEAVRSGARCVPLMLSWILYVHEYAAHNELQLLLEALPLLSTLFIFSVVSQNYPVRRAKLLSVLGEPPVAKWRFKTVAGAATFQCLVLCHAIPRPVRDIDVRGTLDIIIPDQREVWQAWKARVADRITHGMEISFAPIIPTFRDAERQAQLRAYLDEAQTAYETYRLRYSVSHTESSE